MKKNFIKSRGSKKQPQSTKAKQPPCIHWQDCGGCPLIQYTYKFQLQHKTNKVLRAFVDHGFSEAEIKKILKKTRQSPLTLAYRNKAKWVFQRKNKDSKLKMGIYYPGTHQVVDIPTCSVHAKPINEISSFIKLKIDEYQVPCGLNTLEEPNLRYCIVRYSFREKKLIVVFITTTEKVPGLNALIKEINEKFSARVTSIVQNINNDPGNVLLGEANRYHKKAAELTETMGRFRVPVGPLSFLQVNSLQGAYLYQRAQKLIGAGPFALGLDLYSGIGLFAMHMAGNTEQILACEEMGSAAMEAMTAARRNKIQNVLQLCGDALEGISTFHSEFGTPDWVIMNPPRKGCDATVLGALTQRAPGKIIYVSCNPSSLARDLKLLLRDTPGLQLVSLEPVDMFPQTEHVECIAYLVNEGYQPQGVSDSEEEPAEEVEELSASTEVLH